MASTLDLLSHLAEERVDFIIIGGMAATLHGSTVVTEDLDVCIPFERETLAAVLRALAPFEPRHRMHPAKPALSTDVTTYDGFKNLYVTTTAGVLDFVGDVTGAGPWSVLSASAITLQLGTLQCKVMGLQALIASKEALARPKDLRVAAELRLLASKLRGP